MKKKEIKTLAEQKIKEGKSRQETLEEIKLENPDAKTTEVTNIVRYIPTLVNREKYKKLNNTLLILIGISILLKIILGLEIVLTNGTKWIPMLVLIPLINIYFFYQVSKYNGGIYKALALITVLSFLRTISNSIKDGDYIALIFDSLFVISIVVIAMILDSRLCSNAEIVTEKFTTPTGEVKLRKKSKFID